MTSKTPDRSPSTAPRPRPPLATALVAVALVLAACAASPEATSEPGAAFMAEDDQAELSTAELAVAEEADLAAEGLVAADEAEPSAEELAAAPAMEETDEASVALAVPVPAGDGEALPAQGDLYEGEPPLASLESEAEAVDHPDRIVGGKGSYARPEIGWTEMFADNLRCSATLVHSRVALTAAHCVKFTHAAHPPGAGLRWGTFNIQRVKGGRIYSYDVTRFRSLSRRLGANDLAVLQLSRKASTKVARPATIAATRPSIAGMRAWGYGCNRRGIRGFGTKRYRDFTYGGPPPAVSKLLCSGDSGGPAMLLSNGRLALVHSAIQGGTGYDLFADAIQNRTNIWTWINAYK